MKKADDNRGSLLEKAANRLRNAPQNGPGRGSPSTQALQDSVNAAASPGQPPPLTVAQEVEAGPGGSAQVTVDLDGLKAQGYLTPYGERTQVAEEFRIIKRPILDNAFGRGASLVEQGNLIMVTSALPGEGKTYTAVNLAMTIAMEMDKTVLLVDADVGRARIHDLLKIPLGPGLIDLLTDPSLDVGAVMLRTNVPKLRVIPMGRHHPHSNELVASEAMRKLTHELATRYSDRVVIFDAPPVLPTSEAVVLAALMGQIVFVVEAERSLQGAVQDAIGLLNTSKPVGLVLNKSNQQGGGHGYYGSGYAHYGYHGATT